MTATPRPSRCPPRSASIGSGATRASPRSRRAPRRRCRPGRSATNGTATSTTDSCPPRLMRLSQLDAQQPAEAARLRIDVRQRHRHARADAVSRAASGALVFGAGTVQWSWGLDANHDRGSTAADVRMQQATVNLFADMGVQPATLQSGLVAATASTDCAGADVDDHVPANGASFGAGRRSRSAARPPTPAAASSRASKSRPTAARRGSRRRGTTSWTFSWSAARLGPGHDSKPRVRRYGQHRNAVGRRDRHRHARRAAARARSGLAPSFRRRRSTTATRVGGAGRRSSAADTDGSITGVRFYKAAANTGTHTGTLWTSDRHVARHGHVHRRNGVRMAAGELPDADSRSRPTRPTSCRITRRTATTPAPMRSSPRGVDNPPLHALAGRHGRSERRVRVRRRDRLSRPTRSTRRTIGSMWSSRPRRGPTRRRRR